MNDAAIHQYNEVKEKLYNISCNCVWTIFELQVNDISASQKNVLVFSSYPMPKTHFKHAQGHQRAGTLTSSINTTQNTIFIVYEVENQETVNTKLGKRTYWFSEVIKEIFHHNFR